LALNVAGAKACVSGKAGPSLAAILGLGLFMIHRAALAILLTTPLSAFAQTPAEPNTVAGVVVAGGQPPAITSTFPAAGAEITPGVLVLKLVFDQPMKADDWSFTKAGDAEMPDCLPAPRLLGDLKTFVLLCSTLGGKTYGLTFNPPGERAFLSAGERRAPTADLRFSTTGAAPVRTVRDAMKTAGLGELDMPVEGLMAHRTAPGTP
jgi:hypothetical protein